MALTSTSIAAAARSKADHAQQHVRTAETQLHAANEELKDALPRHNLKKVEQAAERTVAAEAQVKQAADELEVVKVLLDAQRDAAHAPAPAAASGEGTRSLLRHLGKKPPQPGSN